MGYIFRSEDNNFTIIIYDDICAKMILERPGDLARVDHEHIGILKLAGY